MKKLLLTSIAALFLATGAAHAQWTEADGKGVIFLAWKGVKCNGVKLTMWRPYNTEEQKFLDFWRFTSEAPIKGKITIGNVDAFPDVFLDGERCMDDNPKGN
jgi:hypothetical protein